MPHLPDHTSTIRQADVLWGVWTFKLLHVCKLEVIVVKSMHLLIVARVQLVEAVVSRPDVKIVLVILHNLVSILVV